MSATHGVDIASQWTDELDLEALRFAVSPKIPKRIALDLGCGAGTQGVRFGVLGCRSVLYDVADISERIERITQALDLRGLEFRRLDLRQAIPEDFPAHTGIAYSQRFIHYLRFEEASHLLAMLASRLCSGARLFISASGMESELAGGYAHIDRPVEQRFTTLAEPMRAKHSVREPVCLYTEDELAALLVRQGFTSIRTWTTPFGNVKGVFELP